MPVVPVRMMVVTLRAFMALVALIAFLPMGRMRTPAGMVGRLSRLLR
jgi:hypothetical protein